MAIGTTSNMEWLSGGGSGTSYNAGTGIDITNNTISVKIDGSTITTNASGELVANGGGVSQVQSDWTQTNDQAVDYIKHKPQNLVQDADYVHTDNNFTNSDKNKLDGIESGAEVNVQANWNETNSSSDAYIQNKPDLSQYATQSDLTGKQDTLTAGNNITITNNVISAADQIQSDWNQTTVTAKDYIKNKPTIPSGNQLVPAATSSDEDKVLTVDSNGDPVWDNPTAFTQQQSDWTQTDNQAVDYIKHKPGAKPVLAGPGIQITETSNDITISTTTLSGISEIQYVQSLPANPVSGVLYLIPLT